jgi:very-short-patch-repair endonuclease
MTTALVAAVRRRGGVARSADLRADGATKRDLSEGVRDGSLMRPRRGLYALPSTPAAVIEALGHRGRIACATAARDRGIWTLDRGEDEPLHTWVDPDRHAVRHERAAEPDDVGCCIMHRDSAVDAPDLVRVGILHCLVQLAGCHGPEAFFVALESALRKRLIGPRQRALLRAAVPSALADLVDFARTDADSGLESLIRLRLRPYGLVVTGQVRVPGVGKVDLVVGDCLILEADGETHSGDNRHRDLVRDARAMSLGFLTLRFDTALILHDWSTVEAAILAACDRLLHRTEAGRRHEESTGSR